MVHIHLARPHAQNHSPLDGPEARARDAVQMVFAGEKVREQYIAPAPDVSESQPTPTARVLNLDALVRMKLTSYLLKDRVHVQDLIGVGPVDRTGLNRLPSELAARLQEQLDNPETDQPHRTARSGPLPRA
jgi:hypothetical protein